MNRSKEYIVPVQEGRERHKRVDFNFSQYRVRNTRKRNEIGKIFFNAIKGKRYCLVQERIESSQGLVTLNYTMCMVYKLDYLNIFVS